MKFVILLSVLICSMANALTCQTESSANNHLLQKCETLHVLKLNGTPVERARTHGQLLQKYLSKDIYYYFANRLTEEMDHQSFFIKHFAKFTYNSWAERFYKRTPPFLLDEMKAQAEAANVDLLGMKRALALPDTGSILVDFYERGFIKTFITFGCTSVSRTTADGNFVYGRNLDFPSATIYDQHPLITVQVPEEGSKELRHITFAADAVQFGGITGVNEAGITFAVHQLMTRDANTFGMPMLFVGEMVLRQAHTLDEAVEVIKKYPPGPMWVFVLNDLNKQETWSVEASATEVAVRKMSGDIFAQTNHMIAGDLKKEIAYSGHLANSKFRMKKAEEIISAGKSVHAEQAAQVLSYQTNKEGELSTSQDVLKGETIQTIIFEKTKKTNKVYVSFDSAPVASGRYLEFDFNKLLDAQNNLQYEIRDFLHTPENIRKTQMKIAKAAFLLDKGHHEQATELLADQKTFDSKIFRAASLIKSEKYETALDLMKNSEPQSETSSEMIQAKPWIQLVSLVKLNHNDEALTLANSINKETIKDREFRYLIDLIKEKKFSKAKDAELHFSLFSGYLSQKPHKE